MKKCISFTVHHILKTKVVVETPRHKQISRLTRGGHSRSQTVPDMGVVLESPDKVTPNADAAGNYVSAVTYYIKFQQ